MLVEVVEHVGLLQRLVQEVVLVVLVAEVLEVLDQVLQEQLIQAEEVEVHGEQLQLLLVEVVVL